jgi:hypothetical protein
MPKNHRKKKRPQGNRRKPPVRASKTDEIIFYGLAIVRGSKRQPMETLIVGDLEAAKRMGLTPDELHLAEQFFQQAAGVRKCFSKTRQGQVCCINNGCSHKCHLYRAKLPIPSDRPLDPDDLGENDRDWVEKEGGYGYWCGCNGWDD